MQVSNKGKTLTYMIVNLDTKFDHFTWYHEECFNIMGQMLTLCASHMGMDLTQFPQMPVFQPLVLKEEDEDEEMEKKEED